MQMLKNYSVDSMLVLGFTGGSGSGKSLASKFFNKFNITVIDTDSLYREMTSPGGKCILPIKNAFGDSVIDENGALNRAIMASIVFHSKEKRQILNTITHKYVLDEVRSLVDYYKTRNYFAVLVDAPLLFESGYDKECDYIISVIADTNIRISRIMNRDKISLEHATSRINSQLSDDYLKENSDFVLINNGSLEDLEFQVSKIVNKIKGEN